MQVSLIHSNMIDVAGYMVNSKWVLLIYFYPNAA